MRCLIIILCFLAAHTGLSVSVATTALAAPGKRVALIIGNSTYAQGGDLANPKNDADDLAKAFRRVGFEVIKGLDLDKQGMDRLIRRFARALRGAEIGAFFYAGHGIQVDGKNYLVPVDAKLDDATGIDFELVRVDVIQRAMERTTSSNLIFLDACRNNPLARNLARAMGTRSASIGRGLASVESGVGTLISFSTQPGNVALDGTGRNSPYAAALTKYLDRPGDNISDILINVRKDVMRATNGRQVPWEHTALTDRIVFLPNRAAIVAAPRPSADDKDSAFYQKTLKEMQRMREALQRLSSQQGAPAGLTGGAGPEMARIPDPANLGHAYDGNWRVTVTSARSCPNKTWSFKIRIAKGRISGGSPDRPRSGWVDRAGAITFEHAGRRNRNATLRYVGQLQKDIGTAVMRLVGRQCRGDVAMRKLTGKRRQ